MIQCCVKSELLRFSAIQHDQTPVDRISFLLFARGLEFPALTLKWIVIA
jgi:hypothetical protein